ncbi:MAG: carboxylating nicotinate-nucleotide diphosphorylase [Gammaproteobacteria bacterium]|nr:carboxylating nicotinate-nucleotide diphosphorylase [Gammaproteobacteria bacterium]
MVTRAIAEDLGKGDLSAQLIPIEQHASASIVCRETAVLCGTTWFDEVFRQIDPSISIKWLAQEGETLSAKQTLCTLHGCARSLLSGERAALNFLQSLSATASTAQRYAEAVAGTGVKVLDTRKTLPGWRLAQKYAVKVGGCHNHRIGLFDAFLIKENHIAAVGGISAAISTARKINPNTLLEVEVETLEQLQEALAAQPDRIMLDNFDLPLLEQAVNLTAGKIDLEASGNITLANIRTKAETGVNYISIGALTKDIKAIDLSMRFNP